MSAGRRRVLPDNLDPLVDTLFNVVGILVFIVALTQVQLGEAIDRLVAIETDAMQGPAALRGEERRLSRQRREAETRLERLRPAEAEILSRSPGDLDDARREIESARRRLRSLPNPAEIEAPIALTAAALEKKAEAARRKLAAERKALTRRSQSREKLESVPKVLVARLPDPAIVRGTEQWILCRYRRCFPTDRKALIDVGSEAVAGVLHHNRIDEIRDDEFESLSHHFRKRIVGLDPFRWTILAKGRPRARLVWRERDAGLDRAQIETGEALRAWLSALDPQKDFIQFHVWGDSFEVYLRAREATEAAGFRAGWQSHETDGELELPLSFGPRPPEQGPVEVD